MGGVGRAYDGDYVEAGFVDYVVGAQEAVGGSGESSDFFCVDGFERIGERGGACLDLYECHRVAPEGNDVKLIVAGAEVAFKYGIALADEIVAGELLAPFADVVVLSPGSVQEFRE